MAAIIIGRMRIIKTMPTMRPTLGEDWTTTGFEGCSTASKKIKREKKNKKSTTAK